MEPHSRGRLAESTRFVRSILVPALAAFSVAGPLLLAQHPELPIKPPQHEPGQQFPIHSEIWKSQATGNEYRVRVHGDTLSAEWVNIPPDFAQRGAYIRTECRKAGDKWIGTSSSNLPCMVGEGKNQHVGNWCRLVTRTEIDSIAPDRITGRAQTRKNFDCAHCKMLETAWADFVWVPVERKVGGRRQ
ncbi:MAG TPA: hypothetical protein VGW33_01585 [Terriglobia bacterium]|nr:hypothetical protein [Terriglobia bacterium]